MENENSQEGSPKRKAIKKEAMKKNKQATVLKQLNNQSLYPVQERIGIYIIAALSTIGLALITYTGVMAVVSSTTNGSDVAIDVDVDELQDMLEELENLTETETEEPTQETEDIYAHAETEPEETEIPTEETETEETEIPAEDPSDEETDVTVGGVAHEPFTATINTDEVSAFRNPASDLLFRLHTGDEITVLDLNYNAYWSRIEFADDPFGTVPRFIRTEFIDVE